ncbi:nose resistant to fluoxetine protein 6-like [Lycorma delicatula]|uniref:nose resistant to fluoxetine protein 6-like n=1 Tax=Lycorma delicatula TaxID=130591 RepID=UPI003F510452
MVFHENNGSQDVSSKRNHWSLLVIERKTNSSYNFDSIKGLNLSVLTSYTDLSGDFDSGNDYSINQSIKTINRDGDKCELKRFKCNNNESSNYNKKVTADWIAEPLMEALWAFAPNLESNEISELCKKHVRLYKEHLKNNTLWAVQMLDSSTLSPSGILSGDNYQLGHFDQCLDIRVNLDSENSNGDLINGKYCLPKIIINPSYNALPHYYSDDFVKQPYSLHYDPLLSSWTKMKVTVDLSKKQRNLIYWAVCVPSSCTVDEIKISLKERIIPILAKKGIVATVELDKKYCHIKTPLTFTNNSITLMLFILFMIVLVVNFSVIDILFYRNSKWEKLEKKGKFTLVMLSFSIYETFSNLKKPDSFVDLSIINGMRTYTTLLVMLGHRFMFTYGSPFHNPEFLEHRYRSFDEIIVLNGFLIVDTFFVISGFLTCYLILNDLKTNTFNLLIIYLHRLLRLTPSYAIVIAIYAYILPLLGDGPLWSVKVGLEAERCQNNWWMNILFINNYGNADICMFQSWFLTCDMHFFLFGPILAYLLHKRPKLGIVITLMLLLISIIIPFLVIYTNNLDGVLKLYMSVVEDPMTNGYVKNIYIKTHNRAGPYIVGILAGYLYYILKNKNFKFSVFQVVYGSIICTVVSLLSLLIAWIFYIPGREYSGMESALYASLHRITWSACMSWIIIAGGVTGYGIFDPILRMEILIPLSRLTYSAFLIHGIVQLYSVATIRVSEYVRYPKLLWMWSADITCSFVFALILHVLFEAPINGLSKAVFLSFRSQGKSQKLLKLGNMHSEVKSNSHSKFHKINGNIKNRKLMRKMNINSMTENVLSTIEKKHL